METMPKVGDLFRSSLTGRVFGLKRLQGEMALLEREDGAAELLTECENLRIFYAKLSTWPEAARTY